MGSNDSHSAIAELIQLYRSIDSQTVAKADNVLVSWALGSDAAKQWDALALIDQLKVQLALPALRELARRFEAARSRAHALRLGEGQSDHRSHGHAIAAARRAVADRDGNPNDVVRRQVAPSAAYGRQSGGSTARRERTVTAASSCPVRVYVLCAPLRCFSGRSTPEG